MHPYRGIVRTYRWSYHLSTRPDNQNTLTCQYSDTNDAPRYPTSRPRYMESCPDTAILYATAMSTSLSTLCYNHYNSCTSVSRAHPLLQQVSDASAIIVIGIGSFVLAAVYDWIRLNCFSI